MIFSILLILISAESSVKEKYQKAVDLGDLAYKLSQEAGDTAKSVDALILKSFIGYLGNLNEGDDCISKAETLLNSILDDSTLESIKRKADFLYSKAL